MGLARRQVCCAIGELVGSHVVVHSCDANRCVLDERMSSIHTFELCSAHVYHLPPCPQETE